MEAKRLAAEKAVESIKDGMVVGLGTGSTVYYAIHKIGELVKQGLEIKAIATSVGSEQIAQQLGINLVTFADIDKIDLTIDGADEVDPHWNLIKGGGGALLREKIVAAASKELIVIADESKVVAQLGKFPLPIEVIPFGWEQTEKKIAELGCAPKLRVADGKPYLTDNGNYILDCSFGTIADPKSLHDRINQIVGVVDNGLFVGYASRVIVGYHNETVKELVRN
ncbi:MAG: ribose-5-phosphate isomerase RpiA [Candidatus Wallacebacter cryptica]|jgi:ribose 5-phosphate isomerase A|nr:ribose-5-phosphate isomerase RpiA [Bacillota bacterium]